LEHLTRPHIRQLFLCNAGLKILKQTCLLAVTAFMQAMRIIYFGLEHYIVKHGDEIEYLQMIFRECKQVGNEDKAIRIDASNNVIPSEIIPVYRDILPAFKKVTLVLSRLIGFNIKDEVDITTNTLEKPNGHIEELTIEFVKVTDQEVNLGGFGKYHA
jgi:hypothetical protein